MSQYDANILKILKIEEIENVEMEEIDIPKSSKYDDKEILILKNSSALLCNPYEKSLHSVKKIEKLETTYLLNDNKFKQLKNKVVLLGGDDATIGDQMEEVSKDDSLDDTEVSQVLKSIFQAAITKNVSDVHILPKEKDCQIKFRETGDFVLYKSLPKSYGPFLINKLKTLSSNMDITNNLKPQDGKASIEINNTNIEVRISTLPTIWGENAVMRVQQVDDVFDLTLEDTGFFPDDLIVYRRSFKRPTGLLLNVGATGSGKTTTFYLTINELVQHYQGKKNIVTAEDPVEIKFDLITQVEVEDRQGRSFAQVLKALMRQDPDIILIGEIRDEETGGIAVKASLTGHAVLATLHANDSITAITRLRDIGISDPLIAAVGNCFISQRLTKKLCPSCKRKKTLSPKVVEDNGMSFNTVYEKVGCESCGHTGYKGRIAISEVLEIDADFKEGISNSLSEIDLKKIARDKNFRNLWFNGLRRAEEGTISFEDLTSSITRDVIVNPTAKELQESNGSATITKREIFYPIKKVPVVVNGHNSLLFDMTLQTLSLVSEEANLLEIGIPIKLNISNVDFSFTPSGYGNMGGKFLVEGTYIGDSTILMS